MVIGKVTDNWNEEKPGMVQVTYGLGKEGESLTDWIPVMVSYAGPAYGKYLLPEVGASVVVEFEQDNKNRPVVLGCIRGSGDTLPEGAANEENSKKLWKSKQGYMFLVDEGEQLISCSDPNGENTLVWSSKDKTLTVNVKEKIILSLDGEPFITLEKKKITIAGDVTVEARTIHGKTQENMILEPGGDLNLKGKNLMLEPSQNTAVKGSKTEISSAQEISLKTQQLKLEGTGAKISGKQLKIEGTMVEVSAQASGKFEASGIMEVKGTMLKLN